MNINNGCYSCLIKKVTCHKTIALQWIPDAPFGEGWHTFCTGCGDTIHNPKASNGECFNHE